VNHHHHHHPPERRYGIDFGGGGSGIVCYPCPCLILSNRRLSLEEKETVPSPTPSWCLVQSSSPSSICCSSAFLFVIPGLTQSNDTMLIHSINRLQRFSYGTTGVRRLWIIESSHPINAKISAQRSAPIVQLRRTGPCEQFRRSGRTNCSPHHCWTLKDGASLLHTSYRLQATGYRLQTHTAAIRRGP
jgi:hypothetical protein